jgi:hypothetical protein
MALLLKADGTRKDIVAEGPNDSLTLEQLQKEVGGFIEQIKVPLCSNVLIVNEDGLLQKLPINVQASKIAQRSIVGDAVLCAQYGELLR